MNVAPKIINLSKSVVNFECSKVAAQPVCWSKYAVWPFNTLFCKILKQLKGKNGKTQKLYAASAHCI